MHINEILANPYHSTFIFAAHGTTTSALSRIIHQLSLDLDVQEKLRKEVTEARARHGDLDYDILMSLPYLDAVCRETLRVFPPVPTLERVYAASCTPLHCLHPMILTTLTLFSTRQSIVLPLAWPVKSADGKSDITSVPLNKDTRVIVSIYNANRSPRIWGPDAEEWKPERWLQPLPKSVAEARLPGVYSSM
jgi:cytochrome P450